MEIDKRFAIVIGINDYDNRPLDFSVNDAFEIAKVLEQKCCFKKDNIYVITSDKDSPKKDISGHLENALQSISKELVPQKDSVFFYFAGHGEYHFDNSHLVFHDSLMEIKSIFNKIDELQPKYQCYVIDACQSGGKVITRGAKGAEPTVIESYIKKSAGALFMYATTESEAAKELSSIKHGLFTYYFLKAINSEKNYDDEGILTPNKIMDVVSKETSKESKFLQTPVIENRTVGYYPFAFKIPPVTEKTPELPIVLENDEDGGQALDKVYFPNIPFEIRNEVFQNLKMRFLNEKAGWIAGLGLSDYEVKEGATASHFDYETEKKIEDSIVLRSKEEKIEALDAIFSSVRRENAKSPFPVLSIMDSFRNEPKYTVYNRISWGTDNTIAIALHFKSNSVYKVSFGVVLVVYQAVYGIGLSKSFFHFDYTGYSDVKSSNIWTVINAYKYRSGVETDIIGNILQFFNSIPKRITTLNTDRLESIQAFDKKAK